MSQAPYVAAIGFPMPKGRIAEQGPDRGQSGVAGAHAVLSFVLQIVEEGPDQGRIEIVDGELARRLAVSLGREDQERPQGMPAGSSISGPATPSAPGSPPAGPTNRMAMPGANGRMTPPATLSVVSISMASRPW